MARTHWHSHNWGGKRSGAGRPLPGFPTRCISITLPEDLIRAVDEQAHQHHMTRSAVIAQYLTQGIKK